MRTTILTRALLLLAAFASITKAQTVYPITDATNPDFIDYGGVYCNLFFDDFPMTINGLNYEVSTTIHFTNGNPAATFGTIDFAYYPPNGGQVQVTSEPLTNLAGHVGPYNGNSNFTANFAGAFNGSINFNIDFKAYGWRGRYIVYHMPNSSFTID
jgi:hypothetical protein